MIARYIRVSTLEQNAGRQEAKKEVNERVYIDRVSGTIPFNERPAAKKIIKDIDEGTVSSVVVSAIDRLGRNCIDILQTLDFFTKRNITVSVENLGIRNINNGKPNSVFLLITSVMSSVAEMERQTLRERQLEGIALAKAQGIYKGRVSGSKEDTNIFLNKHQDIIKHLKKGRLTLKEIAEITRKSKTTVQKVKHIM